MKRIQEKVKDIVEVRAFESLRDFTNDPVSTLAGYHFTDATSELMAKWLDKVAGVQGGNGSAYALAGYRGVGKSHFLATLGAIVAKPELRSRITDNHVGASAQRLLRRHYPVAYVRRGTFDTLLEELQFAVGEVLDVAASSVGTTAKSIFDLINEKNGDLPFVLIIDTALERGERVARDDGGFLGELASNVEDRNIFLGVALDDDIAGADGMNSAIARTFMIDYLDQEHLYKVVNAHVFPKAPNTQQVLHDVYNYFREVLPDFRWSEQRFSSLYPLHPAILEIAPFVRLYVHEFALLSFASEAGERILGRPANSLIALDEVFDNAEKGLRKVADLADAFTGYDRLNAEVVSKIPVMQRLQAKLILKALLLLSLDGQGTTAGEICAGMLIFDEENPARALKDVDGLIQTFATAMPEFLQAESVGKNEERYRFKVSSKDDLNNALAVAIDEGGTEAVDSILMRLMDDRFSDADFEDVTRSEKPWVENSIIWRGGFRRGRIYWNADAKGRNAAVSELTDWEMVIDGDHTYVPSPNEGIAEVIWKPDSLREDEIETLLRFNALATHPGLRDEFSDQIRASLHSYNLSVDRIFDRLFLEDGRLLIDGFDYNFTEEAKAAQTLSEILSIMLEPLFETRYPDHPYFSQRLGVNEVSMLVADLYSGNRQYLAEVQQFAEAFALPLGLVRDQGGAFIPESEENLLQLPLASRILKLVDANGKEPVSLRSIYYELRKAPNGLAREAQQLILAALVAQRQIEFVTSEGDRINRRSLDLQIIWDDIVAVARPIDSSYSAKKLVRWGIVFAGSSGFRSLDDLADREMLKTAFLNWLAEWRRAKILEKFNQLPDDILNTYIWNLAARSAKTLGSVAENIGACLDNAISYEECLARIADAFLDKPEEMEKSVEQLGVVASFIKGVTQRQEIESYLAVCESSASDALETTRAKLHELIDISYREPNDANNREVGYLWTKFQRNYIEHFATQHDVVMKSHSLQQKFDEIIRSNDWWEYRSLSSIRPDAWVANAKIDKIVSLFQELDCRTDVREALKSQPFCTCSFSLPGVGYWESLPDHLAAALAESLTECRKLFDENKSAITTSLDLIAESESDPEISKAAKSVSHAISAGGGLGELSPAELQILKRAAIGNPISATA